MSGPDPYERALIALAATPGVVTDDALEHLGAAGGGRRLSGIAEVRRRAAARGAPGEIVRVGGFGYRMSSDMRAWFAKTQTAMTVAP